MFKMWVKRSIKENKKIFIFHILAIALIFVVNAVFTGFIRELYIPMATFMSGIYLYCTENLKK